MNGNLLVQVPLRVPQVNSLIKNTDGTITINYWNWGETTDRSITTSQENFEGAFKNYTIINSDK